MSLKIRRLPSHLINQIAAGEVVERPASVVKEMVENAIDAEATQIDILVRDGGKSFICVKDNGYGMAPDDMLLAVERHATSKLNDDNLFNVHTLGFRGEAIPSIASISRLTLTSGLRDSKESWALKVDGGTIGALEPASYRSGTQIEVRDLFYATPARLKFLKLAPTEVQHIEEALKRLAMAYPQIGFSFKTENRTVLEFSPCSSDEEGQLERLQAILGSEFKENSLPVLLEKSGITVRGFIGLPTLNRANAQMQFLFVNGRPVKDKVLTGAVRAAYQDYLARDRHPLLCLFLTVPPLTVDMNVHPAKIEVRFQDSGLVRGALIHALRQALSTMGHRSSTSLAEETMAAFKPLMTEATPLPKVTISKAPSFQSDRFYAKQTLPNLDLMPSVKSEPAPLVAEKNDYPLGAACAQVHETFIISQTESGIVVVDQHAAHERLVYEKLKDNLGHGVARQLLLIPEVITVTEQERTALLARVGEFEEFGLVIEAFGNEAILVREVPALLKNVSLEKLLKDLAQEIEEWGNAFSLKEKVEEVCSTMACHGSIRSGRKLTVPEMNDLLRQMEQVNSSGQCNHGRPTYVELKLQDLERLFGRR
jgi:DNA mismatch repair protein MutL